MYTNGLDETAIQFYSRAGGRNVAGATHAMTIGDYELAEEIGHGGMSIVYRATRRGDGAPVAVKVFNSEDRARRAPWTDLQKECRI